MKYLLVPLEEIKEKISWLEIASVPEYRAIANVYKQMIRDSDVIEFDESNKSPELIIGTSNEYETEYWKDGKKVDVGEGAESESEL